MRASNQATVLAAVDLATKADDSCAFSRIIERFLETASDDDIATAVRAIAGSALSDAGLEHLAAAAEEEREETTRIIAELAAEDEVAARALVAAVAWLGAA